MAALIRVQPDLIISTDEIAHATPQMIFTKGGTGYGINDEIYERLCEVAVPVRGHDWEGAE